MRKMRITKSSNTCIMKTTSELFTAKICTKPSNSPELPNCRKHFEVRRCRVSVLNNYVDYVSGGGELRISQTTVLF